MEKSEIIQACENLYGSISASIDNLHKLRDTFNEKSELLNNTLIRINEEYKYNHYIESVRPDLIKIWDFLESNDWIKFQSIMYHYYSRLLDYDDGAMAYTDFLSIRETVEHLLIEQKSDMSVYTRVVNTLKIPLQIIPRQFVTTFYNSDEYMAAMAIIIDHIHEKVKDPKSFVGIDSFRTHVREISEKLISELNEKGYYGTYEMLYLAELMMCYKLGHPAVGSLYINSQFPKNTTKYEDLIDFVNKLWESNELPRSDS